MSQTKVASLPETGYVRLPQIIGNPKANPPIPAVIPVSKSTWWNGIKEGRFRGLSMFNSATIVHSPSLNRTLLRVPGPVT